jgi:hypothetical protein
MIVTEMLHVLISMEVTTVYAVQGILVMEKIAPILMNVLLLPAITMPAAKILQEHINALAIMVILEMAPVVLILMNVLK